jgi:hypothetical protein
MDKNQVAVLLTKDELFSLWSMCGDSSIYWHNHYAKACTIENYYLDKDSVDCMLKRIEYISNKIDVVYQAVKERELKEEVA